MCIRDRAYAHPIAGNCLPHIDVFTDNGYTKEEMKMINETHKILGDDDIKVTATTVRVPVFDSHSESINVELKKPFELEDVVELFRNSPGIVVQDLSLIHIWQQLILQIAVALFRIRCIGALYGIHNVLRVFCLLGLSLYEFYHIMHLAIRDKGSLDSCRLAASQRIEQHIALAYELFRACHIQYRSGVHL